MSSLPWETGKAPVASVNRANFLSRSFIGFLCKPRNISLFLSSVFLSTIVFPYLSLSHPPTPFFLQVPLDPAGAGPRQVVDVTGDSSNVQCCKEQYCIGTWNVRSMNQGKLEVVKQEMAKVNVDILGISKLKWPGMGEFNSDDHYIYYFGQESLRRNGVAILVNKRVRNAVLGLGIRNEAGQRLTEFCQENALIIANTLFQQHKKRHYTWISPDGDG